MNKKVLTISMSLLAITLVSAVMFYGQVTDYLYVHQPISVVGDGMETTCNAGEICLGSAITVSNDGNSDREVTITTNENEDVSVRYVGFLDLSGKDSEWTPTGEITSVEFTLVGDFQYNVNLPEGYVLVYAKDHQDRFNNPAEFVLADNVNFDLPASNDWNIGEDANYCESDGYEHCKGAKLWAVPSGDLNEDGTLSWENMGNYLWETDLIFHFNNDNNEIVVPAGSFITFYPEYTVSQYIPNETEIEMTTTVA